MSRSASPRTWIAPNRNTVGLLAVLLGMWYAGVTQSNGAAYLLFFVLAAMSLVSVVHAWANLRGIRLDAQILPAAFAGEEISVKLRARSERQRVHFGVRVIPEEGGLASSPAKIPAHTPVDVELSAVRPKRGVFSTLRVQIESHYPLGFFSARSTREVAAPHFVYPAPEGTRPLPIKQTSRLAGRGSPRKDGDDFAGVRSWRTGESQRHIDWKAVARGQPLVIKEWSGDADENVELDWAELRELPTEDRLSQLARWIVQAEHSGRHYALRLPEGLIPPGHGEAHYHRCLRRLAAFPVGEEKA